MSAGLHLHGIEPGSTPTTNTQGVTFERMWPFFYWPLCRGHAAGIDPECLQTMMLDAGPIDRSGSVLAQDRALESLQMAMPKAVENLLISELAMSRQSPTIRWPMASSYGRRLCMSGWACGCMA